jgi:hypothetical protein
LLKRLSFFFLFFSPPIICFGHLCQKSDGHSCMD